MEIKLCQCHALQSDTCAEMCARYFIPIKFTQTNVSLHRWVWEFLVFLNHPCQRKPSPTTKESQTRPECLHLEPLIQTPADFSRCGAAALCWQLDSKHHCRPENQIWPRKSCCCCCCCWFTQTPSVLGRRQLCAQGVCGSVNTAAITLLT